MNEVIEWKSYDQTWPEEESSVMISYKGEVFFGYFEDGCFKDYANCQPCKVDFWAYIKGPQ